MSEPNRNVGRQGGVSLISGFGLSTAFDGRTILAMLAYIIRRLAIGIVILVLAAGVFLLVALLGRPLAFCVKGNSPTPEVGHRRQRGPSPSERPLWDRYWIWFTDVLHGNFGTEVNGLPVGQQLSHHLLVTLRMVLLATLLAVFVAVALGVWAAVRKGRPTDHVVNITNFLLLAIPTFVIGTCLKEFVAIPINQAAGKTIFYTIGQQSPPLSGPFLGRIPDYAAHTVLPVLTLILVTYPSWAIYQRSSVLESLDSDYVRLARAKGLPPGESSSATFCATR